MTQVRSRNKADILIIFLSIRTIKCPPHTFCESNEPTPNLLTLIIRDSIAAINQVIAKKKIKLVRFTELGLMDDETYGAVDELKPLPQC